MHGRRRRRGVGRATVTSRERLIPHISQIRGGPRADRLPLDMLEMVFVLTKAVAVQARSDDRALALTIAAVVLIFLLLLYL